MNLARKVLSKEQIFNTKKHYFSSFCRNLMDSKELPFLESKWISRGQKLISPVQLEASCDYKSVAEFIEKLKNAAEMETEYALQQLQGPLTDLGRSNVGKSSLINAVFGQDVAEVSKQPGKTRRMYFYHVASRSDLVMIDAPGYGYARGDQKELEAWGKMINVYLKKSLFLHRVICLIDAEHGIKEVDQMLFELLTKRQSIFAIAITKKDKVSESEIDKRIEELRAELKKHPRSSPIINITSARNFDGIKEMRANIAYMLDL